MAKATRTIASAPSAPAPAPVDSAPDAATPSATTVPAPAPVVIPDTSDAAARQAWIDSCPIRSLPDMREALNGAAAIIRASAPTIQAGITLLEWLGAAPGRAAGQPLPRSLTGVDSLTPRSMTAATTANRDTRKVLDSIREARKALAK